MVHDRLQSIIQHPSPNFNGRGNADYPDLLLMHYTGMKTGQAALDRLCTTEEEIRVSAHYMVEEDGQVIQMVDEANRAWHAGVSWWEGGVDNNARSIGIEIVNPGHEFGYRAFPEAQMQSVLALADGIINRHGIKPWHVIGHSDVAPQRKEDPGELFDWALLAKNGVGLWPEGGLKDESPALKNGDTGASVDALRHRLSTFGYGPLEGKGFDEELALVVTAFQRHWLQDKVDGIWCARANAILSWLLNKKAGL